MENNDLISRSALLELAHNHVGGIVDCNDIARFPAVDAVPVRHGRWKKFTTEDEDWGGIFYKYTCTICGWSCSINPKGTYSFCPNCGAKMDAEVQDGTKQH